jgi:hypothetical protein
MQRGYDNIKVLGWTDDNEFIGTIEHTYGRIVDGQPERVTQDEPCYGWSKGGSFFVYTIESGHIRKLGVVKRHVVLDDEPEGV